MILSLYYMQSVRNLFSTTPETRHLYLEKQIVKENKKSQSSLSIIPPYVIEMLKSNIDYYCDIARKQDGLDRFKEYYFLIKAFSYIDKINQGDFFYAQAYRNKYHLHPQSNGREYHKHVILDDTFLKLEIEIILKLRLIPISYLDDVSDTSLTPAQQEIIDYLDSVYRKVWNIEPSSYLDIYRIKPSVENLRLSNPDVFDIVEFIIGICQKYPSEQAKRPQGLRRVLTAPDGKVFYVNGGRVRKTKRRRKPKRPRKTKRK